MRTRILILLACLSCEGGPTCEEATTVAGGPTCDATIDASAEVDGAFSARGLPEVRGYVHVEWRHGESFVTDDGEHLRGHSMPHLRVNDRGVTVCDLVVADRLQAKVAPTSLAHEMLHCALPIGGRDLTGDPEHTGSEWRTCDQDPREGCGTLADALLRLYARDL